jgi:tetratricopeptide (TPR) repeat protein
MEAGRVVVVQHSKGEVGRGSGYVVAPRLVLTSAHAVEPGVQVRVLVPPDAATYRGGVVWRGTPGGRVDAALVEVADPAWRSRESRVRWGRLVTNRPGIVCQVWGFPALVQRPGRAAETAQLSGTLNPGDGYVGDRYVMTLTGHAPAPPADGSSPWAGLSGAALFCGDLLVGVVAADPAGAQHARLEAAPVYLLERDAGFRAVAARHGIGEMVLEPVELQQLIDLEPDLVRSPAALLRARRQVIPFRGRVRLLDDLTDWAHGSGFAACLLHGPGGQGKTRLAQELARRLSADRWAWLWLRRDARTEELQVLADAAVPLLVIVDYAETRAEKVTAAVRAAARHAGTAPLRMLLLARTAGDWWESLRAADPSTAELLDGTPLARLGELEPEPVGRTDAYLQAVHGFAAALPTVPGQRHQDWPASAARLIEQACGQPAGPARRWHRAVSALTLSMTALADLLDTADRLDRTEQQETEQGGGAVDELVQTGPGPVEDRLLQHERRYWKETARAFKLALSEPTLHDALTAAFLLGAADLDRADALLQRLPGLQDQTRNRRDFVRQWIAHLYPPADGRPWGSLQPDRLAERFVGIRLAADPGLADRLIVGADPAQISQLLTVYARAAHHPAAGHDLESRLGQALTALCVRHPDALAAPAIEVAIQVEAPGPLMMALQRLTTDPDASIELLTSLADQLPPASHRLADWAANLTQRLTDEHRRLASDDPTFRPGLAWSLANLSNRLAELGRWEEALAASVEAVAAHREMAAAHPDTFRPKLAMSLNDLSNRLAELGRVDDALAAIIEAVDLRRELAAAHPDAFRPKLAGSLNNLSLRLAGVGRWEEALAAIREAVAAYRELAATRPNAFTLGLAISLTNLSNRLAELGRWEEALAAIREAVAAYRELAATSPDAFRPGLAGSLTNLSLRLAGLGRWEDALAAIRVAVAAYRELAATRPGAFTPDLAGALNDFSNRLAEMERREEALAAIREAVDLRRGLAAVHPDAFRPDLAASLNDLSLRLAGLGRWDDALAAIREAVAAYRELAAAHADAFTPDLAGSLTNLSNRLAEMGRREDALAAIREAVDLRRGLAAVHPDAFRPDLAMSLNDLSLRLGELGRWEDALAAIRESVAAYRGLAAAHPDAFRPDLAMSLTRTCALDHSTPSRRRISSVHFEGSRP